MTSTPVDTQTKTPLDGATPTAPAPRGTTPPSTDALVPTTARPIPFSRLLRVELRKMVDTRAGMWMLAVMAAASLLVVGAILIWGNSADLTYVDFLSFATLPMAILLPVLGVMATTTEWSQRTGLVTFTLEPRRGRVVAAKILAAVLLALVVVVAGVAAAAHGAAITGGGVGHPTAAIIGGMLLSLLIYTIQGVAFGFLFVNTPVAIVSVLSLPTLWTILGTMITSLDRIGGWLDLERTLDPLTAGDMTGDSWLRLLTSLTVWLGLPLVIGTYRVLTREVK